MEKNKDTNQLIELKAQELIDLNNDGYHWDVENIKTILTQVATHKEQEGMTKIIEYAVWGYEKGYKDAVDVLSSTLDSLDTSTSKLKDILLQSLTTKEK